MALGGAWVTETVGRNVIRLTGRTWGARTDADTIGLFGDAGAGVQLPATWFGTGQTVAALNANTLVVVNPVTSTKGAGPTAGGRWRVAKAGAAPWRITLTWDGVNPAAPAQPEVYVIWAHSLIQ